MKNLLFGLLLILTFKASAQHSGNVNYFKQLQFDETNIIAPLPNKSQTIISIKGMANVKADNFVAVFSLTQVGKTMKQTDSLLNGRLTYVSENIDRLDSSSLFVDMVSFVSLYDVVLERKLFSKNSYNEIPNGFELKKNLHIHFKNQEQLDRIISICAEAEIYNLIRVDYFSKQLDEIKLSLLTEAQKKLNARLDHYKLVLGDDFDQMEKSMADVYRVVYPTERYKECVAYNNNAFKTKSYAYAKTKKNEALYYQPIVNKEFDFVINPIVVEPSIQVMYELKLALTEKPLEKKEKEFILVSPNGELKSIAVN